MLEELKSIIAKVIFKVSRLVLGILGTNIGTVNAPNRYPELSQEELLFCERVFQRSLTMTSLESLKTLALCCKYVDKAGIEGAFVEAGVWRGGSALVAKYVLAKDRRILLYDTFNGMTEPGEKDFRLGESTNENSLNKWNSLRTETGNGWVAASLDEVKRNFGLFKLLDNQVEFIVGDVQVTLLREENLPDRIAILRLDTDFYSSTLFELETFWPKVANGGVVILDDYGHWEGAKSAADEFFSSNVINALMVPIAGGGGRLIVKTH